MPATTDRSVRRFRINAYSDAQDRLVVEAPMEIRLGGVPLAVLMRTPGMESDLVLGFALTEGMLLRPDEAAAIERVGGLDDDRWELRLAGGVVVDPERFRRNAYTTSSCGVCGKASIDAVRVASLPLPEGPVLEPASLLGLPARLAAHQDAFSTTGGLHAAAAFSAGGELLGVAEDIGRHNAVDKLVGRLAGNRWPLGEVVLMVSGRVSFEITQKAAVAGIPVVCGVSAASSLAAELAEEVGMTLVGFLRDGSFVVYAHPHRVG